jgi:hypothetical protein
MLTALFIVLPNPVIPAFLAFDFYIRAFTKSKYSPLSWISAGIARSFRLTPTWIDRAPKVFAARIGMLFSILMLAFIVFNITTVAVTTAAILVLFAFLECGLNFCAGCWVYTYIVLPIYREK